MFLLKSCELVNILTSEVVGYEKTNQGCSIYINTITLTLIIMSFILWVSNFDTDTKKCRNLQHEINDQRGEVQIQKCTEVRL